MRRSDASTSQVAGIEENARRIRSRRHRRASLTARHLVTVAGTLAIIGLAACSSSSNSASSTTSGAPTTAPTTTTTIPVATVAWDPSNPSTIPAFYTPASPLPQAPPGTLIAAQIVTGVPGVPAGSTLWRILYHSQDLYGHDIPVSGYVVAPSSGAPTGGFPVITWAHGTTGVARICAPSLFSTAGTGQLELAENLTQYIQAGYAVTATDYQGLGAPGIHGYLIGKMEGQSVLDAARAAQHIPGLHVSSNVVIVGHSQGGHAALFAGEMAPTYAPDLNVVGTVALAPLTELSLALPLAMKLGGGDQGYLISAGYAWSHNYTDLPESVLFTPAATATADTVEQQSCQDAVTKAFASMSSTQIFAPGMATNPVLLTHLGYNDPGQVATKSPMLILQGLSDSTIPAPLTQQFVSSIACAKDHDTVQLDTYPGMTHSTVVDASRSDVLAWIAARLAGSASAPTSCS